MTKINAKGKRTLMNYKNKYLNIKNKTNIKDIKKLLGNISKAKLNKVKSIVEKPMHFQKDVEGQIKEYNLKNLLLKNL